jgi:ribosomal protein S27E
MEESGGQQKSDKINPKSPSYCAQCHKDSIIFDNSANEFVCSSCGFVINIFKATLFNQIIMIELEQECLNL